MVVKTLKVTKAYRKDFKRLNKRNKDLSKLKVVLKYLNENRRIPKKYKPHPLHGQLKGCMECHIESDWLLIWREEKDVVKLIRTGTHSDLYKN